MFSFEEIVDSYEEDVENIELPEDVAKLAETARQKLIPQKSEQKYTKAYLTFKQWMEFKKVKAVIEDVLLGYFKEMSHIRKPSTIWAQYSMLKATLLLNENINIEKFKQVTAFISRNSSGYQPKKSSILESDQVEKFLTDAPDVNHLATKVALIFGVYGACRREELANVQVADVEHQGNVLLIRIPKTKNNKPRSFTVEGKYRDVVLKYGKLRPPHVTTSRFFLNYQNGKCTTQPIGKNKFGKLPRVIATYLNLPHPESFTGHCFRRSSATMLANSGASMITMKQHGGWKSDTVVQGYVEDSMQNKRKIGNRIMAQMTETASTSTSSSSTSTFNAPVAASTKSTQKLSGTFETNGAKRQKVDDETIDECDDSEKPTKIYKFYNCNVTLK